MIALTPVEAADVADVTEFLRISDLTLSGLDSPSVHLWAARNENGEVCASTGFELSADGRNVLIRSVAVAEQIRGNRVGLELARFVLKTSGRARCAARLAVQ